MMSWCDVLPGTMVSSKRIRFQLTVNRLNVFASTQVFSFTAYHYQDLKCSYVKDLKTMPKLLEGKTAYLVPLLVIQ